MEIAGIVAEYNPFHNGHLYQIHQTKNKTHCDAIIAVISGNFTQRGQAAIVDKFTRTKMALQNGVDLVLELPVPIATASAERFAQGAISILEQSHLVTHLSFGSECGDITHLKKIVNALVHHTSSIDPLIKNYLREGLSYPRAREQALIDFFSSTYPDDAALLLETIKRPNNILGIEYMKALAHMQSSILPFTVQRKGSQYHEDKIDGPVASATAIRQALHHHSPHYKDSMPASASALLNAASLPSMEKLSAFLHFKLMFSKVEELYATWDIPPDLIHTFLRSSQDAPSYETLVMRATSKTYTKATVQRSLFRLLLEIKAEEMQISSSLIQIPYIRVLGCRQKSAYLLKALSKQASIPVLTNLNKQYKALNDLQKTWIDYEIKATKLYAYAISNPALAMSDFTQPFIIL